MAVEIGQEVAVFITEVDADSLYVGDCSCCERDEPETFAEMQNAVDPDGEKGIWIKGSHAGLHGIHIVRPLHIYNTIHYPGMYYWEVVQ